MVIGNLCPWVLVVEERGNGRACWWYPAWGGKFL
jgi:hypothetical protein